MKHAKIFISVALTAILILTQIAVVSAAQPSNKVTSVAGAVTEVTLITDPNTGITTVAVTVKDQAGGLHTVRISEKAAESLGVVAYDSSDGNPFIATPLPPFVEIDSKSILTGEESHHPVANALATYFSDLEGVDYNIIMDAHADGNGFGVIAQALWLIKKMGGTSADFVLLLDAKKNNDFSDFPLDDDTIPTSWGQLKQAVADNHLGSIMSKQDKNNPSDTQGAAGNTNDNSNKDKGNDKDKSYNGSENGNNGQGKGSGNSNGNKP